MFQTGLAIGFLLLALTLSGCLLLMIPSLAYQGYKLTQDNNSSASNTGSATSPPSPTPTPIASDNHDIE